MCHRPLLTAVKVSPPGAVAWPWPFIAPAGHRAIGPQPARVPVSVADGGEGLPGGHRGLALAIIAPAGHRAIGPQPARVRVSAADGGEGLSGGRRGLALGYYQPQQATEPLDRSPHV